MLFVVYIIKSNYLMWLVFSLRSKYPDFICYLFHTLAYRWSFLITTIVPS